MTSATGTVIPFPRTFGRARGLRLSEFEASLGEAILGRELVSVVYGAAVEPQTFAPYVLYFDSAQHVFVGGCEISKRRIRWRDFEVSNIKELRAIERRFVPGAAFSSDSSHYPHGFIVAVDVSA
jgi:hypothetical protein